MLANVFDELACGGNTGLQFAGPLGMAERFQELPIFDEDFPQSLVRLAVVRLVANRQSQDFDHAIPVAKDVTTLGQ